MIKKITAFLIFLITVVLPCPIFAKPWYKYPTNPIIPNRVDKKDLIKGARAPTLLKEGNVIKMWFVNYKNPQGGLDYLTSTDGINWQKPYENLLIEPSSEESDFHSPVIIKDGDTYKLWYGIWLNGNNKNNYFIKYATSADGISWSIHPNPVLQPEYWWEAKGVSSPYVIKVNDKFYLWYSAWGSDGVWRIGFATSSDGINWTKNNSYLVLKDTITHVGNHNLKLIDNFFHLWYLTGDGYTERIYRYTLSNNNNWECFQNDCLVLEKNSVDFPNQALNDSDTLILNNNIYLYLSGIHNGSWQIGLFTEKPIEKNPIIIIPGLFASWNKNALFYNQSVSYDQWKLPSFVHEYEGLIGTLENLGYQKNKDYFIFAYDWRKPLESITEDLNSFINSKNFSEKINLIGHSLGGLVSRIYAQKFGTEKINKIITVGSPHQGAIQVYKPLAAGEIDRENTFFWLAQKLILVLNKSSLESDRETIRKRFPVAFDLFPIFSFLKNEQGELIATDSMSIKNQTLAKYNFLFPTIYPLFTAIYGESTQSTPEFYYVKPPDLVDQLLGNYQDGKPVSIVLGNGDGTVLAKSAFERDDEAFHFDNFNHGEIIYKKEAIEQILKLLNLDYQSSQIVEGKKTNISPSLIFLIRSPASIEVVDESGNHYYEEDGIIFIENAQSGNYQLLVNGKEQGKYQVVIGQIAENNDIWEYVDGEITESTPTNQVDKYLINFNNQTAQVNFPSPTPTLTVTPALTPTVTQSPTPTFTPNPPQTPTATPLPTLSPTPSPSPIPTSVSTQTSSPSPTTTSTSSSSSSNEVNFSSLTPPAPSQSFLAQKSNLNNETPHTNQGQILGTKNDAKKPSSSFNFFPYLIPIFLSIAGYLIKRKFTSN